MKNDFLPYRPKNKYKVIENIKIDKSNISCNYFGQVDEETGKPNGIGVAVKSSYQVLEGGFKNGEIMPTYRLINFFKDGSS